MATKTADTNPVAEFGRQALAALSLNPAAAPQVHQFWEIQEKLLDETEAFSKRWFERRHDAARSALRTSAALFGDGRADIGAAAKAMQDWQAQSAERLAEDLRDWFDMCTRCMGHCATGEADAGRETLETVTQTAAEVADIARVKHATPV